MRAAVGIGANLGDPRAAIEHAVEALRDLPFADQVAVSRVYRTAPVGGIEQPDFLNAVAVIDVSGAAATDPAGVAHQLLELARRVESELHRVRTVRWGPRTVDVDVLAVGDWVSADPELTVPHPRLAERAFVLVPWAEVAPDQQVPNLGRVAALAAALPAAELAGVRPAPDAR